MASVAVLERVSTDHAHRWRIAEANGPISEGVCKICGVSKDFRNWLSEIDYITNEEHRNFTYWR